MTDVIAPENQEGTKATILRWCKAPGDSIRQDEPLLELETDKVTVEVPSPASGELAEILKQPNEEVHPGQILARVRESGTQAPANSPAGAAAPTPGAASASEAERQLLSPAVRRLLEEHALTASDIAGSGRNGRITAQDVARYLGDMSASPASATSAAGGAKRAAAKEKGSAAKPELAAKPEPAAKSAAAARIESRVASDGRGTRILHTPIRRRVAEHMVRSVAEAPHVTTLFEVDLTRVQAHRARHLAEYERQGTRLTYTAYFVAASARALIAHPQVNATFHEDALELHPDANIGIGTALGNEGLIVPVIHGAQDLSLFDIAQRLGQLVAAARAGKLAPQEVRGGTFTLSNHGVSGSLLAAPIIINQPQVAILGVGKVERRVSVIEVQGAEALGIRTMCYLTLTLDHRALDAFQANAFLEHVVNTLEQWPDD
jgi:2-oxoglutarate dehydrogenase E2 component (dihydrolipoamide succinyltransferase)